MNFTKSIIYLLSFLFFIGNISTVSAINFSNLNTKETSCSGFQKSASLYIDGDIRVENVWDAYWAGEERAISYLQTDVKLWQSDNNLVSNCNNSSAWMKLSDFTPASKEKQIAIAAQCTFNKPINKNKRNLQFVFNIGNYKILPGGGENFDFKRRNMENWNSGTYKEKSFKNVYLSDFRKHGNECLNIELQYCGDGIKNGTEQCDYKDDNKTGWGKNGCTETCTADNGSGGGGSNNTCGDGIKNGTEQCDYKDDNKTGWGKNGCTEICTADNGNGGGGSNDSCGDGIKNGTEQCDYKDDNKAGWGKNGCSNHCKTINTGGNTDDVDGAAGGESTNVAICGDGIIQREIQEECEISSDGTFPKYCSESTCKYKEFSIPGEGDLKFGPNKNFIIGKDSNPFILYGYNHPYIQNTGGSDLYIEKLCIYKKHNNPSLQGARQQCEILNKVIPKYSGKIYFSKVPALIGNTSWISNNVSYQDTEIITSIKHKGVFYDNAWFAQSMTVRVAKPAVSTIGGGTSLLQSSSRLSNMNDIVDLKFGANKNSNNNFIGPLVSEGNYSTYSKESNDNNIISDLKNEGGSYNDSLNTKINESEGVIMSSYGFSDFNKYNGLENIHIIKNKSVILDSDAFVGLNGSKTFIVESGNLIIKSDILYDKGNIAFVVKGGNIMIKNNVQHLNGTFIAIPKNNMGGKYLAEISSTKNKLHIQGAVYGNLEKLASNRVYLKVNNNKQLDVGIVINYNSNSLFKPSPLVGQFIGDYINSLKIAK